MFRVLIFGTFLLLVTLFLHWRLVSKTAAPRRVRWTVDAVLVMMWLLALVGVGSGDPFDPSWARAPGFVGSAWLAVLLYLTLGVLILAIVGTVLRSIGAVTPWDSTAANRSVLRVGSVVVVAASLITVGYGVVEAATPKVTNTEIASSELPTQFDGLRVALVSDLHAGPTRGAGFVRQVVDSINEQNPDVVLLDGDLTDGTVAMVGDVLTPLQDLDAPMGVFAVSGNHEFYAGDGARWLDLWNTLGIEVLRNERVSIERDGAAIDIAGVNDATAPEPFEPDLGAALDGIETDRYVLLLAHQPLQAFEASDYDVDLQVSGHTHAGQIWPLRYLVPLQQPTVEGLDTVGGTTVYTTRGAGTWGPPVRVAAPPEISLLELRSN